MPTPPSQPTRQPTRQDDHRRIRSAEEDRELALLELFMRHNSVASLANAIGQRAGVRGDDLIAAAALDPRRADR
jgi:hypothetical protein